MRPATRQEIDRYLASRGVLADDSFSTDFYIIESGEASLMFSIYKLDNKHCDMHICAPRNKASILSLYSMVAGAFEFAEQIGYVFVVTSVPVSSNKTAHNMARKLNFEHVGDFDGYRVYKRALKWQ